MLPPPTAVRRFYAARFRPDERGTELVHSYNSALSESQDSRNGAGLPPGDGRARSAGALERHARLSRRRDRGQAQVLLPVDVPLPVREAPHGARAQLHDRRRAHALLPDARLQRAAADGLGRVRPAGRERGDGERRAAGAVDLRQHRLHEEAAPVARLRDRLGARARHLQARLLPLEPVAVPAHARARHRLQAHRRGELGPGRPDRARQRAGDRRPRLAHRRGGREARDPDVLPPHHAVRGGAARGAGHAARLARAREADAGELDRAQRGGELRLPLRARRREEADARVYHARRHDHGRDVQRDRRRASARDPARARRPEARGLHRRVQGRLGHGGRPRDDGEEGLADRLLLHPSADRRAGRDLGRQLRADGLRRGRRDGRAGARRARLRVRQEIRAPDQAGDRAPGQGLQHRRMAGVVRGQGARHLRPLGKVRRPRLQGRHGRDRRRPEGQGPGRQAGAVAAARLGHLAPALLGHAGAAGALPRVRRRAGARRRACRSCCPRIASRTAAAIRSRSAPRS